MNKLLWICIVAAGMVPAALPASAQEVVHALTGTVSSIDPATKSITVLQDSGAKAVFKAWTHSGTRISFDKRIAESTTDVVSFQKQGAYVVVFYFGNSDAPTAVAIKPLGSGPFDASIGTVTKTDGHKHSITIADKSGKIRDFSFDEKTVIEGNYGALEGSKLDAHKGDRIRIVSSIENGTPMALFIRQM